MQTKSTDVLIIGAGLTGLALAYYLKQLKISVTIVEARNRIGGRIYTTYNTNEAPMELGATWLTSDHTELFKLLKELNITVFEQHYGATAIYEPNTANPPQLVRLPPNNAVSYRINNGTQNIINTLAQTLDEHQILLNCAIKRIEKQETHVLVTAKALKFQCGWVVSTLPPYLFQKTIITEPVLPLETLAIMQNTHTWMHDSIKVGFTFKQAFWKNQQTSGTIYSNVSPLQEFYDHSNADGTLNALVGFMNGTYHKHSKKDRQKLALNQLQKYFGNQVLDFLTYEELVWKTESFTSATNETDLRPHENNGHDLYQQSYLNQRLFISGTETNAFASGKMEGAIRSAIQTFKHIKNLHHNH